MSRTRSSLRASLPRKPRERRAGPRGRGLSRSRPATPAAAPVVKRRRPSPAPSSLERWLAAFCFVVGAGAIGGPLVRALLDLGFSRFSLVDPQHFEERHIGGECGPDEVGASKASAVAARISRREAFAIEAGSVARSHEASLNEGGALGARLVVLAEATVEERREAHRYAARARVPLFSVEIDPRGQRYAISAARYALAEEGPPGSRCAACRAEDSIFSPPGAALAKSRTLIEAAVTSASLMIGASLERQPGAISDGEAVIVHPGTQTSTRIVAWQPCRCSLEEEIRPRRACPPPKQSSRSIELRKKRPPRLES